MTADTDAALRFLRTAYEPGDWIAIFLKSYKTGRTAQRVGPLALFLQPRVHAWLRAMNAQRFNIYVSVNAIKPGVRARTKEAIGAVRHLFLEADQDGSEVLAESPIATIFRRRPTFSNHRRIASISFGASPASRLRVSSAFRSTWRMNSRPTRLRGPVRRRLESPDIAITSTLRRIW